MSSRVSFCWNICPSSTQLTSFGTSVLVNLTMSNDSGDGDDFNDNHHGLMSDFLS